MSEQPFGRQLLEIADQLNVMANEARKEGRYPIVESVIRLHSQQLYALAESYPSVDESDVPIKFPLEEQR